MAQVACRPAVLKDADTSHRLWRNPLRKERRQAKRELADEIKSLRIELAEAGETIAELRRMMLAGNNRSGGDVIDLLPVSRRN